MFPALRVWLIGPFIGVLLSACGGGSGGGAQPEAVAGVVVTLAHGDVAYDRSRQVYYASVSSSDPRQGNRIATIDRFGATLATSQQVGSEPRAIAVSRDGTVLYVGVDGSGELIQLALPQMTVLARLSLPVDPFSGASSAEQISVSPADAQTVAVSLTYRTGSPRHAGVALVRNMTMLPNRTPFHLGSNRVVFDRMGAQVFGFNTETTEFGLRRLQLDPSGLTVGQTVSVQGASFEWDIDSFGDIVMVGSRAFATADFSALGNVAEGVYHCVGVGTNGQIACLGSVLGQLIVAESRNFTRLGTVAFPETSASTAYRLVAGPTGQVAASSTSGNRIYLIDSELLR